MCSSRIASIALAKFVTQLNRAYLYIRVRKLSKQQNYERRKKLKKKKNRTDEERTSKETHWRRCPNWLSTNKKGEQRTQRTDKTKRNETNRKWNKLCTQLAYCAYVCIYIWCIDSILYSILNIVSLLAISVQNIFMIIVLQMHVIVSTDRQFEQLHFQMIWVFNCRIYRIPTLFCMQIIFALVDMVWCNGIEMSLLKIYKRDIERKHYHHRWSTTMSK